ncbi:MAG: multidrug efflux SMR transporter [Bacteroidales bacterium]|nr:multidrug efflux SMR transporter [Bacteroidales bacterium]
MAWVYLILSGIFEVLFTFCLGKAKMSVTPVSTYWYIGFVLCLIVGMSLLVKATQSLPIGTAYAIFTGIGAVGTVLTGIFIFNEPATFLRIFFITTLIISIIGLKLFSH